MKTYLFTAATLGLISLVPLAPVRAQDTVVTTTQPSTVVPTAQPTTTPTQTTETNSAGTITSFTPGTSQIVMKTSTGTPATYTYSKKTTFVDASGNVVNYESIKAGEPTTVYYTTVDGQPVVSKVVVHRTAPTTVSKTETTETTTTTSSKH